MFSTHRSSHLRVLWCALYNCAILRDSTCVYLHGLLIKWKMAFEGKECVKEVELHGSFIYTAV